MANGGKTTSQIAHTYNIPRSTVQSVLKQNKSQNTVERAKGSGRPMKTTNRNHQELKQLLETNRKTKLSNITDMMTTKISAQTALKKICDMGYGNHVAVKKPFVNKIQAKKQLAFACKHLNWTVAHWGKVIWSNKSSFEIGKLSEPDLVWQTRSQKYNPDCLQATFKSGRTSTMVWGAFFSTTKLLLVFLPPKEKKETDFIKNVYKPTLIPFLKQENPKRKKNLILMEDNAPIHTAKICSDF
jgi:predicted transcriptional regulator